jgi:hypothetical protein
MCAKYAASHSNELSEAGTILVLLEFTGVRSTQKFGPLLSAQSPGHIIRIDPIDVGFPRHSAVAERAGAIADRITAAGARRVVLVAACTACVLLAPLTEVLRRNSVEVAQVIAVDPGPVTPEHLSAELEAIAHGLGAAPPSGARLLTSGAVTAELVAELLDAIIEEAERANDLDADERRMLRESALERYLDWLGYLYGAIGFTWTGEPCNARVLAVQPDRDLTSIFGRAARLTSSHFDFDGRVGLMNDQLERELRVLLTEAGSRR